MQVQVTNYPVNLLEFLGVPTVNLEAQSDAIDTILNYIANEQYNKIVIYGYKYGIPFESLSEVGVMDPYTLLSMFKNEVTSNERFLQILSEDFYEHDDIETCRIRKVRVSAEEEIMKLTVLSKLSEAIAEALDEQEQKVIEMLYYNDRSLKETEEECKCENCEHIRDEALKKLLTWLQIRGLD